MYSRRSKLKLLGVLAIASCISFGTMAAEKPRWGKAKHKCTTGSNGLVWAKLKGVKFGKKKKTCNSTHGRTAPPFNARGASGKPSYCKSFPTGVYGYWKVKNDKQCKGGKKEKGKQTAYWDKSKHRCTAPGKGEVTARLLGVDGKWFGKKGRKMALCKGDDAPSINALGVSGKPNSCKKKLVHVYGTWKNNNDALCQPKWKTVKAKGCMGPAVDGSGSPFRQVERAKITKLKNGGKWWEPTKWKWPLTDKKREWAREACLNQEHPVKGKPDYCKVRSGVWAYWYSTTDKCETPLKWAKFKDEGCVKDMQYPNLSGPDLNITGKRSYSARLKKVKGNWSEACLTWPIISQKANDGRILNAERPTGCNTKEADEVAGVVVGTGLSAAAAYYSLGATAKASGGISAGGALVTGAVMKMMDTTTSIRGILWVDDNSCR